MAHLAQAMRLYLVGQDASQPGSVINRMRLKGLVCTPRAGLHFHANRHDVRVSASRKCHGRLFTDRAPEYVAVEADPGSARDFPDEGRMWIGEVLLVFTYRTRGQTGHTDLVFVRWLEFVG
eukprot:scaffold241290_cov33-Tisochrysis_lutea.AAC.1